jgi:diguanylate cyclase (GGDEF)-like protein
MDATLRQARAAAQSGRHPGLIGPPGSSFPPALPNTVLMAIGDLHRALDRARDRHHEDHEAALDEAVRCHEIALGLDDPVLRCRALVLEAAVALQRGDLQGGVALTAEAEPFADDDTARAELAAVKGQLNFFAGAYPESLAQAERAVELADRVGDLGLRVFARRYACVAIGNIGVPDLQARLQDVLRLSIAAGNAWDEAMSRNDLAHYTMLQGDLDGAEREIAVALATAEPLAPDNRFALAVLSCTRAEIRLRSGRAEDALADAERAVDLLVTAGDPNPYLLAMSVVIDVQALLALARYDEAERTGRRAVERLGERVPQARSMILTAVAEALREAGRTEEAYSVLAASAEVERRAFQELSALQRGLERATLETRAARSASDALAAKNRELESVVRELHEARRTLERRTQQLETLQEQLREQADRDWLTGLHNRRYLAREADRHTAAPGPFSLAVLDLDHFKLVNDRFGHQTGDEVLMRVAALLLGTMRGQDVVVRTGGEEFVLLMPHTDADAAAAACERLRTAIREEPWDRIAPGIALTASIGVATAQTGGDLRALTELADQRVYAAKGAGRDRVVA